MLGPSATRERGRGKSGEENKNKKTRNQFRRKSPAESIAFSSPLDFLIEFRFVFFFSMYSSGEMSAGVSGWPFPATRTTELFCLFCFVFLLFSFVFGVSENQVSFKMANGSRSSFVCHRAASAFGRC